MLILLDNFNVTRAIIMDLIIPILGLMPWAYYRPVLRQGEPPVQELLKMVEIYYLCFIATFASLLSILELINFSGNAAYSPTYQILPEIASFGLSVSCLSLGGISVFLKVMMDNDLFDITEEERAMYARARAYRNAPDEDSALLGGQPDDGYGSLDTSDHYSSDSGRDRDYRYGDSSDGEEYYYMWG